MAAKLRFIYGTMGSAKTMRLLATAYDFEQKGIGFLAIKPAMDNRDGVNIIKSRIGIQRECISFDFSVNLYELIEERKDDIKWVLVDECQFMTEKQVNELALVVDNLNIEVMCYGLRTNFLGKCFGGSKRLFEIADEIEEVKAYCSCGNRASFNARFDENGKFCKVGEPILIGGDSIYKPICRKCFFEKMKILK